MFQSSECLRRGTAMDVVVLHCITNYDRKFNLRRVYDCRVLVQVRWRVLGVYNNILCATQNVVGLTLFRRRKRDMIFNDGVMPHDEISQSCSLTQFLLLTSCSLTRIPHLGNSLCIHMTRLRYSQGKTNFPTSMTRLFFLLVAICILIDQFVKYLRPIYLLYIAEHWLSNPQHGGCSSILRGVFQ